MPRKLTRTPQPRTGGACRLARRGLWLGLWVDLKAAGIERIDSSGRKIDFHALRHTFCTLLMSSGVPVRVVQEMMRHSEMRLTTKIYTDAVGLPTVAGINKLPSMLTPGEGTHIGTHNLVKRGQTVSRAVAIRNIKLDAQPVDFQAVVGVCRNMSASGKKPEMAERGGFEPPVPV